MTSDSITPPPEWDLLLSAAQKNQPDRIRSMITHEGVNPSHANSVGQSALHIACLWGHVECVTTLLQLGANPQAANALTGATPLIMTMQSRKTDVPLKHVVCQALIEYGADVSQADAYGQVPVDYAAAADVPTGHALLALLAPQEPPIFLAIDELNVEAVRNAVAENPAAATTPHRSETPLQRAVTAMVLYLDTEMLQPKISKLQALSEIIVQVLLPAGAAAKITSDSGGKSNSTSPTSKGSTTLLMGGGIDGMSLTDPPPLVTLLEALRDRLVVQETVPDAAIQVVKALYPQQALTTEQQSLLWHNAARRGQLNVLQFLHAHLQWPINATNRQGMTALHFGARSGQYSVVQWLLQQPDIQIHCADERGQTPRQAAVTNERTDIVTLLDQVVAETTISANP